MKVVAALYPGGSAAEDPEVLGCAENALGALDPMEILTQREPATGAIEAYETFDQRHPGWIKVELLPEAS